MDTEYLRTNIAYNKEEQTGIYELLSVTWQTNGQDYKVVLSEVDMKIVYGVNKEIETEPDDVLIDKELLEEVEAKVREDFAKAFEQSLGEELPDSEEEEE